MVPCMDTTQIIGSNIRRRREQLRLSLDHLGGLVGVTGATICRWEQGAYSLPVHRLDALAVALYCKPQDLTDPAWRPKPPHPTFADTAS